MSAPPFGIPNRPRIRHRWDCPRTAPAVEVVKLDDTGQAVVIARCEGCHAEAEREEGST